ncbi:MAG: hypothetical protein LIO62_01535 [Clostridiales bacterium]|nr:hypothetical protein [Clostridiales bacterium]
MSAQTYLIISIVAFAVAGVLFLLAVFLFIKFNIPRIIGDLSGKTAKKSIAKIRSENEKKGKKSFRPHPIASDRGQITEKIRKSEKLNDNPPQKATDILSNKNNSVIKNNENETVDLDGIMQTDILNYNGSGTQKLDGATQMLDGGTQKLDSDTKMLDYDTEILNNSTRILSNEEITNALNKNKNGFEIIQSIVLIHTNEVI